MPTKKEYASLLLNNQVLRADVAFLQHELEQARATHDNEVGRVATELQDAKYTIHMLEQNEKHLGQVLQKSQREADQLRAKLAKATCISHMLLEAATCDPEALDIGLRKVRGEDVTARVDAYLRK